MTITLACMHNREVVPAGADWPQRETFMRWLFAKMADADVKNLTQLAARSGLRHTTTNGWANGRAVPRHDSLTAVADVLGVSAQEAWAEAGLLTAADRVAITPTPGSVHFDVDLDAIEPAAADRRRIQLIKDSGLSARAKARLIENYLDDRRRAEEELDRKVTSSIAMLEDPDEPL